MFGKTGLSSGPQQICILTQGNAPAHTALPIHEVLAKNKIIVVPHHPYAPQLVLFEFLLFPKLNMPLKRRRLNITLDSRKITWVVPKVMSNIFLYANREQQTKESMVVDGPICCVTSSVL
jgi:hypothetical protein